MVESIACFLCLRPDLVLYCPVCLCVLSPRTLTSIEDSDVYQMLQRDQEEPQAPRQSGSFKALQEFIDSDGELFLSHKRFPPQHKNISQVEKITAYIYQQLKQAEPSTVDIL